MTETRFSLLIRIVAAVDLLACLSFATPWTFNLLQGFLRQMGPLPVFDPLHVLFVYLLGTLGVTWAIVRLVKPQSWLALADGLARLVFAAWEIYFLLVLAINPGVWGFVGLELVPAFVVLFFCFRRSGHITA